MPKNNKQSIKKKPMKDNPPKTTLETKVGISTTEKISIAIMMVTGLVFVSTIFTVLTLQTIAPKSQPVVQEHGVAGKTLPKQQKVEFVTDEIIIQFKEDKSEADRLNIIRDVISKPVKALVDRNNGKIIQQDLAQQPSSEQNAKIETMEKDINLILKSTKKPLEKIDYDSLMKQYPNRSQRSECYKNNNCAFYDLSLWQEVKFTADIPVKEVINKFIGRPEVAYAEQVSIYRTTAVGSSDVIAGLDKLKESRDNFAEVTKDIIQQTALQRPASTPNYDGGSAPPTQPNDYFWNKASSWDPSYHYQWDMELIEMLYAWPYQTGLNNITVAVSDTGIDYTHEDFGSCTLAQVNGNTCAKVVPGYDYYNGDNDPMDDIGHGTHVSGTIGALTNNGIGMAGIAGGWSPNNKGVKIMPLKICGPDGCYVDSRIVNAFDYAISNGADVMNMSWGGIGKNSYLEQAISNAYNAGIVLVAAAGNSSADVSSAYAPNNEMEFYPANFSQVITVGSIDHNAQLTDFSNWGHKIDLVAPGGDSECSATPYNIWPWTNILSLRAGTTDMYYPYNPAYYPVCGGTTYPYNQYQHVVSTKYYRAEGTSMAAPHVAGVSALILSSHPTLTNEQVRSALKQGAVDLTTAPSGHPCEPMTGLDNCYGAGYLYAPLALSVAADNPIIFYIKEPKNYDVLSNHSGNIEIKGSAYGGNFSKFIVKWAKGQNPNPGSWSASGITLTNGGTQQINNGTLATWNPSGITTNDWYSLKLIVYYTSGQITAFKYTYYFDTDILTGWPKKVSDPYTFSSPTIGDLDSSYTGYEIVIGSAKEKGVLYQYSGYSAYFNQPAGVYAWHADGTPVKAGSGGLLKQIDHSTNASPIIADVNNDGQKEVIVNTNGQIYNTSGPYNKMYVIDKNGNNLTGWPQDIGGFETFSSPTVADLDKGFSGLEIFAQSFNLNLPVMWGWHYDGNLISANWPISLGFYDMIVVNFYTPSPVITDLDLYWGNNYEIIQAFDYQQDLTYVWQENTSVRPNWPYANGNNSFNLATLSVANLDPSTNSQEVLQNTFSSYGNVRSLNENGSQNYLYGTQGFFNASPAIGDTDLDGKLEIVTLDAIGYLYVWQQDSHSIEASYQFNEPFEKYSSPALADIDGDDDLEIIAASGNKLYAFHHDMTLISGFPKMVDSTIYSSPTIGDINNDSHMEVVVASRDGKVYIWSFSQTSTSAALQWPTFHHDERRTGLYKEPLSPCGNGQCEHNLGEDPDTCELDCGTWCWHECVYHEGGSSASCKTIAGCKKIDYVSCPLGPIDPCNSTGWTCCCYGDGICLEPK